MQYVDISLQIGTIFNLQDYKRTIEDWYHIQLSREQASYKACLSLLFPLVVFSYCFLFCDNKVEKYIRFFKNCFENVCKLTIHYELHRSVSRRSDIGRNTSVLSPVTGHDLLEGHDGGVFERLHRRVAVGQKRLPVLQPVEPHGRIALDDDAHQLGPGLFVHRDALSEVMGVDHWRN
ncbi:hypothetical protein CDAR_107271 [Caerostris darwini]|uniref:Uncharacterized protein n=1 Tax=Caerostris darwini TaxID=1538125 RepID=A0AAV4VPS0_9ARAC|nr:hypothetical protein CDAR_107271 [Caerostris darwini]